MNISTVLGIVLSFVLIGVAAVLSTENVALLWNPLGLLIVLGGTVAASMIAFPMKEVLRVFRIFWIVLKNEKLYIQSDVAELARITRALQGTGFAQLEKAVQTVANPFLRLGLELVVDGASPAQISNILTYRIEKLRAREQSEANVFRGMAAFAPALGMVGTLLGLVNMLTELGGDIAVMGVNLAVALMTTLYGVLAANVLFKPVAMKLEHRTQQRVEVMNLVLEGVLLVEQRRSPTMVKETMAAYLKEHSDELSSGQRPNDAAKEA